MTKKQTVILLYPQIEYQENYKHTWLPFSLLSLAGTLLRSGFSPVIADQNRQSTEQILSQIEPYLDDAIFAGLSIMTGGRQIAHALELADCIRQLKPELPLVWGGPHVSALPRQTVGHHLVDIGVVGQGDLTVCELASALQKGSDLSQVPGLCMKTKSNADVVFSPARPFERKNRLPSYPWQTVHFENYINDDITINTRTLGYVSSQGCPYRCKFCYECGTYNGWWSGFDADVIAHDVETLIQEFGINGLKFYDADFFVKPSRVAQFCELLKSLHLDIKWAGSANPNDILRMQAHFPELLRKVKETGCTRILMGMESGSDNILQFIDKQVTREQLQEVAQILTNHQFIGSFTFIVGFPGETADDIERTLSLIDYVQHLSVNHESRLHIFAPYPGTPLYDVSVEYGFVPHANLEAWSDYNYYLPQTPWMDEKIIETVKAYTRLH